MKIIASTGRILLFCCAFACQLAAADTVRIIMRAFIPGSVPGTDIFLPVPNTPGHTMLQAPLIDMCFETDNRSFSNDPAASSRISTDFTLNATDSPTLAPAKAQRFKAGTTRQVDCSSGALTNTGQADTGSCTMGEVVRSDDDFQVISTCGGKNPLTPVGTPSIDYDGSFIYNRVQKTLALEGDIGAFPAFEAYASLDGGPLVKIMTAPPADNAGPGSLYDFWLTVNTRHFKQGPVKLTP